jgi:hypothetical protein
MIPDPTPDSIIQHLLDRFEGTRVVAAWGERSIFYNPGGEQPDSEAAGQLQHLAESDLDSEPVAAIYSRSQTKKSVVRYQ